MICPTCHRDGYAQPTMGALDDPAYRARRLAEAREQVSRWRAIADKRVMAGLPDAAKVWRIEAGALERECERMWGDVQQSMNSEK